mgnify:CR=1 FL=1
MVKLIIGVKGTGKTKSLINLVNEAAAATNGTVVCIEKGTGLRFDVKHTVRLINTNEYLIFDCEALYGFIAGILASNHDVTDVFVDSALKIANNEIDKFDEFVKKVDELSEKVGVNVVMTSSIPCEEASAVVNKYL